MQSENHPSSSLPLSKQQSKQHMSRKDQIKKLKQKKRLLKATGLLLYALWMSAYLLTFFWTSYVLVYGKIHLLVLLSISLLASLSLWLILALLIWIAATAIRELVVRRRRTFQTQVNP